MAPAVIRRPKLDIASPRRTRGIKGESVRLAYKAVRAIGVGAHRPLLRVGLVRRVLLHVGAGNQIGIGIVQGFAGLQVDDGVEAV